MFQKGENSGKRRSTNSSSKSSGKRKSASEEPWSHDQNCILLKWLEIAKQRPDFWMPATLDKALLEAHPYLPTVPKLMCIDGTRFEQIVRSRNKGLWSSRGQSWVSLFHEFGMYDFTTEKNMREQNQVMWFNLSEDPTSTPLSLIEGQ